MKTLAMLLFLVPTVSFAQSLPAPPCNKPFVRPKGATIERMNAAQYHFAQGVWVATPPISGLPESDGGFIMTAKGKEGGMVLLTEQDKLICAGMTAPQSMIDMLKKIKEGPGESM